MEYVVAGVEDTPLLSRVTEESRFTIPNVPDGANNLKNSQRFRLSSEPDKAIPIHDSPLVRPQLENPNLRQKMIQFWQSLKSILSDIAQTIRVFFGSHEPVSVITAGPFESPFEQHANLLHSVAEDEEMDETVDLFIETFSEDPHKLRTYIQEDARSRAWRSQLRQLFQRWQKNMKPEQSDEAIVTLSKELSDNIRLHIRPAEWNSDPVVVLGRELAAFHSDTLAKNQHFLRNHLPKKAPVATLKYDNKHAGIWHVYRAPNPHLPTKTASPLCSLPSLHINDSRPSKKLRVPPLTNPYPGHRAPLCAATPTHS
ncbi:hypothetical protein PCANC_06647 [Puccinia coronata f. sp. avenae]|uniref:Uncharacterized protein n=1 Tax=Puccinia coronata f. sp. avenae TaxID=200324 RepID=A0A2N5T003_9BASI|nr:hypothetical protein PCANC_06647 [Puccinia coronata f. sp. avenae]